MSRRPSALAALAAVAALAAPGCLLDFDPALLAGGCAAEDPLCAGASCCDSPVVEGGTFSRGFDASESATQPGSSDPVVGWQPEGAALATVSTFQLDAFEVTVRRFRRFVDAYEGWRAGGSPRAGAGAHPRIADSGWQSSWSASLPADADALAASLACDPDATYTEAAGVGDERPINCTSWHVALAFCIWDRGRLPTEAEWAYAAAGGEEQRAFPWSIPPGSVEVDSVHAVYGDMPIDVAGSRSAVDVGRFGQHDLAGNVREWTLDSGGDLAVYPFADACHDCASLVSGDRVRRGGDFGANAARSRTAYRSTESPDTRTPYTGVRCAR